MVEVVRVVGRPAHHGNAVRKRGYAAVMATRGIMLSYSDSNEEIGYLAVQWSLYCNQKLLTEICADYDIELRLFHDYIGSISRGGGPMNETLLALPNESITGYVKCTERSEAIAEKYTNPRIVEHELEQLLKAQ